ncbi:hypothetical protein sos41_10250 [Alphaproteobacteria bacterium SO-S41]|nr:hypothetical protein sos41_10250 [Alphaproteobacteria bacterium SO-S41]
MFRFLTAAALLALLGTTAQAENRAIYRMFDGQNHFMTADCRERNEMRRSGFNLEGALGYISDRQVGGTTPLYRLYNGSDYFYTTSSSERRSAMRNGGYDDEGIAGYVATNGGGGTVPLYRGYKQKSDDHIYSTDQREVDSLPRAGYTVEGVAGYLFTGGTTCRGG